MTFLPENINVPGAGLGEGAIPPYDTQSFYQNLSKLSPKARGKDSEPLYVNWDVSLVAGQNVKLVCDSGIPDYWIVTFRPVANTKVSVFIGPQDQGSPHRLGGGGSAKLPGLSEYLTIVVEAGSAAVIGTVIAVRGYDVSMSGGNV